MNLMAIAKLFLPPVLTNLARYVRSCVRKPESERVPEGWEYANVREKYTGWDVECVVETQRRKWSSLKALLEGTGPLGISHEGPLATNVTIQGDWEWKNPRLKLCPPIPTLWPEPEEHPGCEGLRAAAYGTKPTLFR
jgi:hypothetical protein